MGILTQRLCFQYAIIYMNSAFRGYHVQCESANTYLLRDIKIPPINRHIH